MGGWRKSAFSHGGESVNLEIQQASGKSLRSAVQLPGIKTSVTWKLNCFVPQFPHLGVMVIALTS